MNMEVILKALQGKKTHLLVLAFIVLTTMQGGFTPDVIQEDLMALMVSTFKAGLNRSAI